MTILQTGFSTDIQESDQRYQIGRSLRFRPENSSYLSKTYVTNGNTRTWTWSAWVKLTDMSAIYRTFFSAGSGGSNRTVLGLTPTHQLEFYSAETTEKASYRTNKILRDSTAPYHIVVSLDTNNSTTKIRIFINGVLQGLTTVTALALSASLYMGSATPHSIGSASYTLASFVGFNLSEVNFIDGLSLSATEFGEFDENSNWVPKQYTGSHGTNGYYLNFSNTSSVSSLGLDSSGNNNHWSPNNFSLTINGVYDSLLDVPLGSGIGDRGNYATLNPAFGRTTNISAGMKEGNLWVNTAYFPGRVDSTFSVTSGKWYWEVTCVGFDNGNIFQIGVTPASPASGSYAGVAYGSDGSIYTYGAEIDVFGEEYTTGDVIGIALDMDNAEILFYKNGVLQDTFFGDIGGELNGPITPSISDNTVNNTTGVQARFNFGQQPFKYNPPIGGFKRLHTGNLPTPVIKKPRDYFDIVSRAGTGSNTTITGLNFKPGLIWEKRRTAPNTNHVFVDIVRGGNTSMMNSVHLPITLSEETVLSATQSQYGAIKSLDDNGFSTTAGSTSGVGVQGSGYNYVDWIWRSNATAELYESSQYTKLLIHGDSITDASVNNKAITINGNTALSSVQSKFGTSSILFDGSGDNLSFPAQADFDLTGVDFTIELWFYPTKHHVILVNKDGVSGASWAQYTLSIDASGKLFGFLGNGNGFSPSGTSFTGTTTITLNTWNHAALAVKGSTCYGFLNGLMEWSGAKPAMYEGNKPLFIGREQNFPTGDFAGFMEEIRITKGRALYVSNFAVPENRFLDTVNTDQYFNMVQLLIHGNGSDNSNSIIDNSFSPKTLVPQGVARISTSRSKFGGSSLHFGGAGSYLTVNSSPNLVIGTKNFCTEFWLNIAGASDTDLQNIFQNRDGTNNGFLIQYSRSEKRILCGLESGVLALNSAANSIQDDTWYHIALVRFGLTFYLYINGVLAASQTPAEQNINSNNYIISRRFANDGAWHYLNGYIDDLRVTIGNPRYTANFGVPNQEFSHTLAGTLLNNDGGIPALVAANQTSGFSIVTYTGTITGAGVATVGHGLGVAPKLIITKSRNVVNGDSGIWLVRGSAISNAPNDYLLLDTSGAVANDSVNGVISPANSSVFNINGSSAQGAVGNNIVAYCFAEVPGYSRICRYMGDGNVDGPFIDCGFKPRWVMFKNMTSATSWIIFDTMRNTYNVANLALQPNTATEETASGIAGVDIIANGVKIRDTSSLFNASGNNYLFVAFADSPFKYSLGH